MKNKAFTLVELLTVIAIIGILAALLLPVVASVKTHALKVQARIQISDIVTAIQNYDSAYSRMPVSLAVRGLAASGSFTYGGTVLASFTPNPIPAMYQTNNSEIIAILLNETNYPDGTGPTVNVNYQKNPQQTVFLNAKQVSNTNLAGIGPDLVYRDPWKNPYVITVDLLDDSRAQDAFYTLPSVIGTNSPIRDNIGVWSAGPDGKVDPTTTATSGVNKDNITSWQ